MMEVFLVFVIVTLQNLLLCVSFLDELGNEEMAFCGVLFICILVHFHFVSIRLKSRI